MVPLLAIGSIGLSLLLQGCSEDDVATRSNVTTTATTTAATTMATTTVATRTPFLKLELAEAYVFSQSDLPCALPFHGETHRDLVFPVGRCLIANDWYNQSKLWSGMLDLTNGLGQRLTFIDGTCGELNREAGEVGPSALGELACNLMSVSDGVWTHQMWNFSEVSAYAVRLRSYNSSSCDDNALLVDLVIPLDVCMRTVAAWNSSLERIEYHYATVRCSMGEASVIIHDSATCDDAGTRLANMDNNFILLPSQFTVGLDGGNSTCTLGGHDGLVSPPFVAYHKVDC